MKAQTLKTDLYSVFINGDANTPQMLRIFGLITALIITLCLTGNYIG